MPAEPSPWRIAQRPSQAKGADSDCPVDSGTDASGASPGSPEASQGARKFSPRRHLMEPALAAELTASFAVTLALTTAPDVL
eukprot:7326352-Lingulodinium_polyedra.AAC.1